MKWLLVWWIVNPGHTQMLHIERGFSSPQTCQRFADIIPVPKGKSLRAHCSME